MSVILLVVFASLMGTMLLQLALRLFVIAVLTALGAPGVLAAFAGCAAVAVGWGGLQTWLWARVIDDEARRPWLNRALVGLGSVTIAVSLHHFWFGGVAYPGVFLLMCYLQLFVTLIWVLLAAFLRGPQGDVPQVGATVGRVLAFTTGLGLLGYAIPLSNLAMAWGVRPEASPAYYLTGCQAGTLLGMLLAPLSAGARLPLLAAIGVSLFVTNPYLTVLLQLGLSALTLIPGGNALADAWRFTLGLTAGRILGRVVGFLLVGQEGVALLEPIAEEVVGLLSLRRNGS